MLTAKQQLILDFLTTHFAQHQRTPTIRAIAEQFGIKSPNGVMCHLKALERKGYITRDGFAACGIRLNHVTVTVSAKE